jgi:3-methyladenine DNA glycosylase AlkD
MQTRNTDMSNIIKRIRQELKGKADDERRIGGENYFKERVKLHGVKKPLVDKIGKEYFKEIKGQSKAGILSLCEELWKSGYMEESFIACNWSYNLRKQYEPKDFIIFEKWVKEFVSNWASCDTLCNHTIGSFIEMYPSSG